MICHSIQDVISDRFSSRIFPSIQVKGLVKFFQDDKGTPIFSDLWGPMSGSKEANGGSVKQDGFINIVARSRKIETGSAAYDLGVIKVAHHQEKEKKEETKEETKEKEKDSLLELEAPPGKNLGRVIGR